VPDGKAGKRQSKRVTRLSDVTGLYSPDFTVKPLGKPINRQFFTVNLLGSLVGKYPFCSKTSRKRRKQEHFCSKSGEKYSCVTLNRHLAYHFKKPKIG